MSSPADLHRCLDKNTTELYSIEYQGFLSNHITHGIIALHRLGASVDRLEQFVKWYCAKLERPTDDEKSETIASDRFELLRGKEASFYAILSHYKNLVETEHESSIDRIIAAEFPKLSAGIAGAAFHGAIQLGYCYAAKHKATVLEGLAYLHFAYRPVISKTGDAWINEIGKGNTDILEVLEALRADKSIRDDMLEGEKAEPRNGKKTGTFQKRTDYLLTKRGDRLKDYALLIQFPNHVYQDGDCNKINVVELGKQMLEWIVTVYVLSEAKNDFFLLHGVTCTWALCQVIPALHVDDAVRMLAELLVAIAGTYVAQNAPKLSGTIDETLNVSDEAWDELIKETISEDRDEHVYKLVQVCHEQSLESGHSKPVYLQASHICLNNKLSF